MARISPLRTKANPDRGTARRIQNPPNSLWRDHLLIASGEGALPRFGSGNNSFWRRDSLNTSSVASLAHLEYSSSAESSSVTVPRPSKTKPATFNQVPLLIRRRTLSPFTTRWFYKSQARKGREGSSALARHHFFHLAGVEAKGLFRNQIVGPYWIWTTEGGSVARRRNGHESNCVTSNTDGVSPTAESCFRRIFQRVSARGAPFNALRRHRA